MLLRRSRTESKEKECPHTKALPRWENVEDVGNEERASHYFCSACCAFLPPRVPARD
jgi:hypothetical protein